MNLACSTSVWTREKLTSIKVFTPSCPLSTPLPDISNYNHTQSWRLFCIIIMFKCHLKLHLIFEKKNHRGEDLKANKPTHLDSTCATGSVKLIASMVSSTLRTLPKKSVMRTLPGSLRKRSVRWPGVDTHWLLGHTLNCGHLTNTGKQLRNTHHTAIWCMSCQCFLSLKFG